jgi:hypothetical protein
MPLRVKKKLSGSAACVAAGFDGVLRDYYQR